MARNSETSPKRSSKRMTAAERREQLIAIARTIFADHGVDATTVEEIAAKASVSKPVVYEHFGGKEGLYAVVVDREVQTLLGMMRDALTPGPPRLVLQQAAIALLSYIEQHSEGFRILVRDSPVGTPMGSYVSIISDIAHRVEDILGAEFKARGYDAKLAPMYAQMLVGMVGTTGQWWLNTRKPAKDVVAAHLVNLAWNGLSDLERKPQLIPEADEGA